MSAVTPFNRNDISLFLPNQIAGLALWLDAADSSTVLTSGSSITAWNDKSGNRYNASAFGTPTYVNNVTNNLSAIRFNGTSSYFSIPGNQLDIATEDFAVFAVIQYTPKPASPIPIIGKGMGTLTTQQWRLSFDPSTFQILILKNSVAVQSYTTYTTAGWTLFGGVIYRATSIQGFINGNGLSLGTTIVGSLSDTATNVEIGRGWGGNSFFNSDMGEILLYKGTITATQRQQIESYLAYKWNLQGSLPTTHPYYNSPYNAYPPFTNINQTIKFAYPVLPTNISGLSLWLDAADSNTVIRTGSSVSAWNDKSGNGSNATQVTAGNRPTYTNNGVSFSASSSNFLNINIPFNTSHSIFLVGRSTSGFQNYYYGRVGGGAAPTIIQFYTGTSIEYFDGTDRATFVASPPTTSPFMLNFVRSFGNTVTGFYLGSNAFSIPQTWTFDTVNPWAYIGRSDNTSNFLNATVSEFMIFRTALSTTQRQQMEGYLAYKWNLQGSLPVNHPYYNNPITQTIVQSIPSAITMYQYNPKSVSGIALWLDAADRTSITQSGGNVSVWRDKSGNSGRDAVPSSGSGGTYPSNSINGLATIGMTTTGNMYAPVPAQTFPNQLSAFVVFMKTGTNTKDTVIHRSPLVNSDTTCSPFLAYTGTRVIGNGTTFAYINGVTNPFSNVVPTLYNFNISSNANTTWNEWINGSGFTYSLSTGTPGYNDTSTSVWLGAGTNPGNPTMAGVIAEVIMYNTTLTTIQRQQVEGYLAWKWALQTNLPSTHPYKLFPP